MLFGNYDETGLLIIVALIVVMALMLNYALGPTQISVKEALEQGTVALRMSESQVLQVWGTPSDVTSGAANVIVWVYGDPFRTVTFDNAGYVMDYVK